MRSYDVNKEKIKRFFHVDLYRINSEQEIIDLGLIEIIQNPENIIAVEWPEKFGSLLPKERIDVTFEYINENERKIIVQ